MVPLTDDVIQTIQSAAKLLTGYRRRQFQAEVALKYCNGSARYAETTFGWGRAAVDTGLNELRTGIRCLDAYQLRGRKKTEELCPQLEDHVRRLVDPQSQADPKFQTPLAFTRITAKAVRDALQAQPQLRNSVPCRQTVGRLLNRLGYRLRRVLKVDPKKIPETDAIFQNVQAARVRAANDPDTLRISLDTKATVKIGELSRGGRSRGAEAVKAVDHDMSPDAVLVPFGLLELNRGTAAIDQTWVLFGHSKPTSDFIADSLEHWWKERKPLYPGVKRLHIELDNGPEIASRRTQFMKRLVEFVDRHRVEAELVYLPPYHSKYNPIERCWGILEQHWNGTLLRSVQEALNWAGTMTWRKLHPLIRESTAIYERGVRITKKAFLAIAKRLIRSQTLPKWSLVIRPHGSG